VLLFLAGMAFTASASFRTERESGALELLLVCPLSVSQIIMGRLRGIWMQFLPSAAFLALCIHVGAEIEQHRDKHLLWWFLFLAFVTLPVIGLFFSMTRTNFMVAWLLTLLAGIVIPILFVATPGIWLPLQTEDALGMMFLAQVVVGVLFWRLLYSRLQNRRFAFAHA
jgi:ABC-type transport system involved in cytochrome c biogenesis permease component